jgi:hypothetical protein
MLTNGLVNEMLGLPEIPFPLVIEIPELPADIVRPVNVTASVFTCIPTPELTRDNSAPVVVMLSTPCGLLDDNVRPLIAPKYLLFVSVGS